MSEGLSFDVALSRPGFALTMAQDLPAHGITAITGPSGGGKTTLLRILAGLEPSATGVVSLGGRVLQGPGRFAPPHRRGIGYVFQEPRLFPHLDVAGNLAYGARRRGSGRTGAVADMLDLGPLMTRSVSGLSGGEARRVALGRVLASDPDILLLDEPLAGLDPGRKAEILPHIARASQMFDLPALFVSHAMDEVLSLADRVVSIADGRITGPPVEPPRLTGRITAHEGNDAVLEIEGTPLRLRLDGVPGTRWSVALSPEGAILSHRPPGPSTARVTLKSHLVAADPATLTLTIGSQTLIWPRANARDGALGPVTPGQDLWLSVLVAFPRPEPGNT